MCFLNVSVFYTLKSVLIYCTLMLYSLPPCMASLNMHMVNFGTDVNNLLTDKIKHMHYNRVQLRLHVSLEGVSKVWGVLSLEYGKCI